MSQSERVWLALGVLRNTSEPAARRQRAIKTLVEAFQSDEAPLFVGSHLARMLQALEPLLHDRNEQLRKEIPAVFGALGAATRPNPSPFCAWLVHALHSTSGQAERLPNGLLSMSTWSLLLLSFDECLQLLLRENAAVCIVPCLPEVLERVRAMLDGLDESALATSLAPLLSTLSATEFVQATQVGARAHGRWAHCTHALPLVSRGLAAG
eukprot:6186092-Pleurochrysis_carterae.AAC.1